MESIASIEAPDWNRLANPPGRERNPFLAHEFLNALESSRCVGKGTGWAPVHLVLKDKNEALLGAMPLYLKTHSYGEYVFDHGWADAFERAGGRYYPKLQCAVPFTPVTSRRLLCDASLKRVLLDGAVEVAGRFEVSSLHATFPDAEDWQAMAEAGWLQRQDQQFHWFNENYRDFQDFLDSLSSRKRKQIRREREQARSAGIEIEILSGAALAESHWDAFFQFYMDTGSRKWGRPYLNREFFSLLSARMAEDVVLVLCRRNRRWIAGALNLKGSDALFGRNWGCIEDHPFLHFEACYYQAIDYAIRNKLARVEAGAQGPHKLARGYRPTLTYSAHWIADRGFRDAVANYLKQERQAVERHIEMLDDHLPFRQVEPLEEEP